MKTFPDHCLEYAEKATKGPWEGDEFEMMAPKADIIFPLVWGGDYHMNESDVNFVKKARTDLPELAKRLTQSIRALKILRVALNDAGADFMDELGTIISELERMPE